MNVKQALLALSIENDSWYNARELALVMACSYSSATKRLAAAAYDGRIEMSPRGNGRRFNTYRISRRNLIREIKRLRAKVGE